MPSSEDGRPFTGSLNALLNCIVPYCPLLTQTNEERSFALEGHSRRVLSIASSSDGSMLISGSSDKTIKLWELTGGRTLGTLQGHKGAVWSVDFQLLQAFPCGRFQPAICTFLHTVGQDGDHQVAAQSWVRGFGEQFLPQSP